jgi:hypothetical protein
MEKITQPKPRGKLVSWRDDHQGLSTAEKTPKVPKPIYNCGAAPAYALGHSSMANGRRKFERSDFTLLA